MSDHSGFMKSAEALARCTGVVIPVYLPASVTPEAGGALVAETAAAFLREVGGPEKIFLCVDGPGPGEAAARAASKALGVRVVATERNRGKLSALRAGMARLLELPDLKYFVTADQDGDHFANELLNFVRAVRHVEHSAGTDRVMVLGRRISRHRPMGFLRGELEELADRVLLDALHYDAAIRGRPLRLEFAAPLDEFPDFHSGYKLFTRATAEAVFLSEPNLAGSSEECYYRHAVEAVLSVEAILSGAILSVVNRTTFDEQPLTTFGLLNRRHMVADKMIWPCRRLNAPGAFVAQWMANHLPRLLLGTHAPEGREELLGIRRRVLDAFGVPPAPGDEVILRPKFI